MNQPLIRKRGETDAVLAVKDTRTGTIALILEKTSGKNENTERRYAHLQIDTLSFLTRDRLFSPGSSLVCRLMIFLINNQVNESFVGAMNMRCNAQDFI